MGEEEKENWGDDVTLLFQESALLQVRLAMAPVHSHVYVNTTVKTLLLSIQ